MEYSFTILNEDEDCKGIEEEWAICCDFYGVEVWHNHENDAPTNFIGQWWRPDKWGKCSPGTLKRKEKVTLAPCHICKEDVPEELAEIARDVALLS